jgi:hypothetical protein
LVGSRKCYSTNDVLARDQVRTISEFSVCWCPIGHTAILAWSWLALSVAIASTMLSFLISQMAVDRQLDFATGAPDR